MPNSGSNSLFLTTKLYKKLSEATILGSKKQNLVDNAASKLKIMAIEKKSQMTNKQPLK